MIISSWDFARANGLKLTGVDACIQAFAEDLKGHIETKGASYLLDDDACEIILSRIKERELRFVSRDLQAKDRQLFQKYRDVSNEKHSLFIEKHTISMQIIEAERKLRSLEQRDRELEDRLGEIEREQENLKQQHDAFQKEAYKRYVFMDDRYDKLESAFDEEAPAVPDLQEE